MRIRLMGAFAHLAGAGELEVRVKGRKKVGEILREVIPRFDEFRDKIIIVNGMVASEEAEVGDEDEVRVMPVLSGG
ncbi:MoaD/ThiS family protein [Pyrococcus yayanosii]|uniref:Putative molybdopterin converting factor, subunit 1 n=1 Tax=Pyrococcus yayanosii (strain CH1 / JCM 16557) TaxID=529709 RepID=F8AHH5_PYRYC|nr:putative molybdopterin converting factor, subunit 1 [Pyrococcus yayanosii CH1]